MCKKSSEKNIESNLKKENQMELIKENQSLLEKKKKAKKELDKINKKSSKFMIEIGIINDLLEINNLNYVLNELKKQKESSSQKKIDYLKPNRKILEKHITYCHLREIKYDYEELIKAINYEIESCKSYLGPNNDYSSI